MTYALQNDLLKVEIKKTGAELSSLKSVKNSTEFIWQADPEIWGSHAPNLFPIIGCIKDDSYIYENKKYTMTKHGFARNNSSFIVKSTSETEITFQLNSSETLYKMFPFLFQFEITYTLEANTLIVNYSISNIDNKTLFFSVGGHPAFNCPLFKNETYSDYYLEFEKPETSKSYLLDMQTGLVTDKTKAVFTDGNKIKLKNDLFIEDALIFKDLKSRKVSLKHHKDENVLTLKFKDFPFLGVWAKPNAPYVCIEPWLGIADSETTNQKIEDKEGIIAIKPNTFFNANYSIEIDQRHLV